MLSDSSSVSTTSSDKNTWYDVTDLKTTAEASRLISRKAFQSELLTLPHVFAIKLKINESLKAQHAKKPKRFEFQGKRIILISYESSTDASQKIIFWRKQSGSEFLTLRLTYGHSAAVTSFALDFLSENLRKPDSVSLVNFTSNEFHLIDLADSCGHNLLMRAVSYGNFDIFNQLLALPFDVNKQTSDGSTAADIAWKNGKFEILLHLLKANSTYPADFNPNKASEEIKNFLKISLSMHEAVRRTNKNEIKRILKANPGLWYFYDANNISAVTTAIFTTNIDTYKLLTDNNVLVGPLEKIEDIFYASNDSNFERMKMEMRELHSGSAKNLPEKHLMIHYANSVVGHDNQHVGQRQKLIKKAFEVLDSIEETNLILRVVAAKRVFKTHFDFNRNSVQFMDPYCGTPDMTGLFHSYGHLYIAMKEILEESTRNNATATISHEMDHFALVLVFGNEAKPYTLDDHLNEERFDEIIKKCEQHKDAEKIVRYVYENYHPSAYAAELMVRVPQMVTFYIDNPIRLAELRVIYAELFEYNEEVVVPKMKEALPVLEKLSNNATSIQFNELNDTIRSQVIHSIVKFQGEKVRFSDIVGNDSEIFDTLSSEQIREILYGENYFMIGWISEVKVQFYADREFINYNINTNKRVKSENLSAKLFDRRITRSVFIGNFVDSEDNMEYNEVTRKYEWNEKVKTNTKSFTEISTEAEQQKMILLSDHAGAGKTTTFKHLVCKLKEKFSNYWISFIDLKRHLRVYEKSEKEGNLDDVSEILLEILSLKSELEAKIFTLLFRNNRAILLFDGVDEISPKFKEFFITLITNIRKSTSNQQWIATRPQHAEELIQNFKPCVYKLLPYNDDYHRENFIKKVLTSYDIIDESQQEKALNKIFQSEALYTLNINNPLMLHMVTEIYIEDERLIENSNMFSIYEGMIEMKKKILIKKGEIVNQDRENQRSNLSIWDVHMVYALRLICGDQIEDILTDEYKNNPVKTFINLSDLSLMKRWKKQKTKWTPEMISRYGFLYIDHWNTENEFPDFAHRTFAEFFVAKWVLDNVFLLDQDDADEVSDKELTLRLRVLIINMCNNFTKFIYVFTFIMAFLVTQHRNGLRPFNERFSNFLKSDMVMNFMLSRCKIYIGKECNEMKNFLYATWAFCHIQSMSSLWKLENGQTFLQKCFNECDNFNRIRFLLHGYKGTFGASFFEFTGYERNTSRQPHMITEEKVIEMFDTDFLISSEVDESYPYRQKLAIRFFEIRNLSELFVIPENEQRNFFMNCSKNILNLMLKCSFVTEKAFESFDTLFRKEEWLDRMKSNLIEFYACCRSDKSIKFSLQINHFWCRFEHLLGSKVEMLREILLANFEKNHPLIHATLFGIENVITFYERLCTKEEVDHILTKHDYYNFFYFPSNGTIRFNRSKIVEKHFASCTTMEKFFLKKFLMNSNENGHFILALLKQKLREKGLSEDQRKRQEKVLNICIHFLNAFLTNDQVNEMLDLESNFDMKRVLNEQELFILNNLEDISRKANWNDTLQMILLNDIDDTEDTPYFRHSREELERQLEEREY